MNRYERTVKRYRRQRRNYRQWRDATRKLLQRLSSASWGRRSPRPNRNQSTKKAA